MWRAVILMFVGMVNGLKLTDPFKTPSGQIQGIFSEDEKYLKFFGIPYAQVNAKNPFGISTPHPGFQSIFQATNDTLIMCPQPPKKSGITITLDCLNLNIFVPNNAGPNIPVLVWIYGGGYKTGYARKYDGERFIIDHEVIFVSLNYRLGPYGFMCLDTEEVPGNQGLRDQHLAFKWISENIAAFGGDPNRITAIGTSSGAVGLDLYVMSEVPKFINQVILQSGTRYYPYTITPSNKTVPIIMAKHLGFDTPNITEALSFLATVSTESVIAAYTELNIIQRPCIEKKFPNVERMISSHPEHDITIFNNISIMAGFADHEGLLHFSAFKTIIEALDEQLINSLFQICIDQEFDTSKMDIMVDKVRRFYLGDVKVKQKQEEIIDFLSDFFNISPIQRAIIKYAAAGVKVYQYLFSYDGERNYGKKLLNIKLQGASHGDDLGYILDMPFFLEPPTKADQLTIDRMTRMWTNFVKYGNPTPTTSELLPVIWPPVTDDVVWYLDIGTNLTLGTRPYRRRILFWDLFYAANQDKLWISQQTMPTASDVIPVIWPRASKDVVSYVDIDSNFTVATRPYQSRMLFWDLFLDANQDNLWEKWNQTSSSVL